MLQRVRERWTRASQRPAKPRLRSHSIGRTTPFPERNKNLLDPVRARTNAGPGGSFGLTALTGESPSSSLRDAIKGMEADEVMRRYASGDAAAFDELYAALSSRLYSFCIRLAGKNGDADDLFQETFLKMHRSRATYLTGANVLHWAFAIVRSTYLDRLRKRARRPEHFTSPADEEDGLDALPGNGASPEAELRAQSLARLVERELQQMSEKVRSAYILIKIEGLTAAEAAAILGTTSEAAKQRAFRAHEVLRAAAKKAGWSEASDA